MTIQLTLLRTNTFLPAKTLGGITLRSISHIKHRSHRNWGAYRLTARRQLALLLSPLTKDSKCRGQFYAVTSMHCYSVALPFAERDGAVQQRENVPWLLNRASFFAGISPSSWPLRPREQLLPATDLDLRTAGAFELDGVELQVRLSPWKL